MGAYVRGSDPDTDFAIERVPTMRQFLRQGLNEAMNVNDSLRMMSISLQSAEPARA